MTNEGCLSGDPIECSDCGHWSLYWSEGDGPCPECGFEPGPIDDDLEEADGC